MKINILLNNSTYLIRNRIKSVEKQTTDVKWDKKQNLIVETKNDNVGDARLDLDSSSSAIWPVLAVAQCFAIMPVTGIRKSTHLEFRWRSFRAILTLCFITSGFIIVLTYLRHLAAKGVNAGNVVGLVFLSCCITSCLLFLFLAREWSKLISIWTRYEMIYLKQPYANIIRCWTLSKTLRLTAIIIFSSAIFEHILYLTSHVNKYLHDIDTQNITMEDHWKGFFISEHGFFFESFSYCFFSTFFLEWTNLSYTFTWNYMDAFVIMISISLTRRFRQLNERLQQLRQNEQNIAELVLFEIRQHYSDLCELVEIVDATIAPIIFLSCANNMYFICFQLLNIFNKLEFVIDYFYYWYSLSYLIGRTLCVFLCAASINDESRKPLIILRTIPTTEWSVEMERFIFHLRNEMISLTGMRFFNMTRKGILGAAATILTYEFVLFQFEANKRKQQSLAGIN